MSLAKPSVPRRGDTFRSLMKQIDLRLKSLWQTKVERVQITSTSPLKVIIDETETLAVAVAGMTYVINPTTPTGIAFRSRSGLPVVLPAA